MTVRLIDGIAVDVIHKNVRNINLRVTNDCRVTVSAPMRMSDAKIDEYVSSKKEWIEKALIRFKDSGNGTQCYDDSNTVHVLGNKYTVRRRAGARFECDISDEELVLTVPEDSSENDVTSFMNEWYRAILKTILPKLILKWEMATGLRCSGWQTRIMRTKWGTCNCGTKRIWFNVRLAEKPIGCIEYVVLHELAHTAVPNHGPEFKAILDRYMPDWKEKKRILNYGFRSS